MVRPFFDPENSYSALPSDEPPAKCRRQSHPSAVIFLSGFLLMGLLMVFIGLKSDFDSNGNGSSSVRSSENEKPTTPVSRGVSEGVSEKSNRVFSGAGEETFPWNNSVLSWQRSAFHFQPQNNWMNDPNGPLYYKGWYHLFYQYNPNGAIWGDIVWGHAISEDLIHWLHLPLAMVADQWYDSNGVWTGSATILHDGQIIMLYTGSTNASIQVQNLAYPSNPNDPLLLNWVKYSNNPVLYPPPGIGPKDFRDPTTAWYTSKKKWRITIGSKVNKTGLALVYETSNFKKFEILEESLHQVPKVGMWECVDFYPISKISSNGLDTSINGDDIKHVMKASMDDDRHDYYAIGSYDEENVKWVPDDSSIDVGIGLRYDYGLFYASKTFFDPKKDRRVLWGWIDESDSEKSDVIKGWASLQSIPRSVVLDRKTGSDLLQWAVDEVESLRLNSTEFHNVELKAGSVVPLNIGSATQLDILAEFEVNEEALKTRDENDDGEFSCHGGVAQRGGLGPFGLLVLADESLSEQTPVYFHIVKKSDGNLTTFFCTDQSRSSVANDVDKKLYGSIIPVLDGEKLSLRILVDHSIVESFAQKGRRCITARVYPTKAIYGAAKLFLFNNASSATIKASIKIWQMNSAFIHPYHFNSNGNFFISSFPIAFLCLGFVCVACSISGFLFVWLMSKKRGDLNHPLL